MNAKFDKYTGQARTATPLVQANDHAADTVPWWLRVISCFSCKETYWEVRHELDGYFLSKVGKGALQTICLLFHNGPTCMRYVETYGELLRMTIYRGVFDVDFLCQEVIPLC